MPVQGSMVQNNAIRKGDVIIERTERGRVSGTFRVQDTGRCATDASNVHVSVIDQKSHGVHNWCMFGLSESEVSE